MKSRFENIKQLADLIYDKLADNDENEMFDKIMTDNMAVVFDKGTAKIGITSGDTEYVLELRENKLGNFEIFENESMSWE